MAVEILSDITVLDPSCGLSPEAIEKELEKRFGKVLRWAITGVEKDGYAVTFTYSKEK